ncbi:MAG: hypothetical protein M1816_005322 [Peltula sp. TS41687]|nr:MAG: hypothetical protein M1816_005322 [Peltula sp. TS41687]
MSGHDSSLPHSHKDNPLSIFSGPTILSDVLGKERSINIFAGLTRDVESVSKRCEDDSQNSTVLAPKNSVLAGMPRKPWEDAEDYSAFGEKAYDGSDGRDRANKNLRRFVEAHIMPVSPWPEGEEVRAMNGRTLRWEMKDGKKMIQPGNVEVTSVANQVANGEVWIVNGVIDRDS